MGCVLCVELRELNSATGRGQLCVRIPRGAVLSPAWASSGLVTHVPETAWELGPVPPGCTDFRGVDVVPKCLVGSSHFPTCSGPLPSKRLQPP